MAANYTDILTPNWSLALNGEGEVVTDMADIAQCLGIIFNTRTGSDPLRPTFGTEIWRWVDRPVDVAVPAIRVEILRGVELWEPRAEITKIVPTIDGSKVVFAVYWRSTISGESAITNFNLRLSSGY